MNQRILVCEITIAGGEHFGKARIMVNTTLPKSQDVELMRSILYAMPGAIDSVNETEIREISKVQTMVKA